MSSNLFNRVKVRGSSKSAMIIRWLNDKKIMKTLSEKTIGKLNKAVNQN
jgi:hypothetical protein